jgi:hypothetical protein
MATAAQSRYFFHAALADGGAVDSLAECANHAGRRRRCSAVSVQHG